MKNALFDITRQFIIFCGVGVINTALGLGIILFLSEIIGTHYILANAAGYLCGLGLAYILHRNITFKNTAQPRWSRSEFITFSTIFIAAYLVQLGALVFMVSLLNWPEALSQFLAISIYVLMNYAGHRLITFQSNMKDLS